MYRLGNTKHIKDRVRMVFQNDKQFWFYMWHWSCCSCMFTPGNKNYSLLKIRTKEEEVVAKTIVKYPSLSVKQIFH